MELEHLQNEEVFEPRELSPPEQLEQQWKQQPGFIAFAKQKNVIDQNAELLAYAGAVSMPGWASPRAFAIQGLVLIAVVLSFFNWYLSHDRGKLEDEIVALQASVQAEKARQQGIIDAAQLETKRVLRSTNPAVWRRLAPSRDEALQQLRSSEEYARQSLQQFEEQAAERERDLRAGQRGEAIANSGTPLVFSLALVLAAGLVAGGARRDFPRSNVRAAGDFYLYLATAYGVWPNLVFLLFLHFALSGATYGLSGLAERTGPLFWVVFWAGFYLLLLRYFVVVARDMYKALQIRQHFDDWSLENKMLLRIHNSFWTAFGVMEAAFLSLTYLFYVATRRFA
jgi:hypothetical protein